MNEFLYNNEQSLKDDKRNLYQTFIISLTLLCTTFFVIACTLKLSDHYETNAIYSEETQTLKIVWPLDEIDLLKTFESMNINKIEPFEIVMMSEIMVDDKIMKNYQIIEIKSKEKYQNNLVLKIDLISKKELLIQKIKKIIFGKD